MHILFTTSVNWRLQDLAAVDLDHELRKWCYQHGVDYHACRLRTRIGDGHHSLELPSDRAYQLFLISWNPQDELLNRYRFIRY
jgi:hypothetical protein